MRLNPYLTFTFFLTIPFLSYGQVNKRYPYRIPDWLWKDQMRSAFIEDQIKERVESDIFLMETYYESENHKMGDSLLFEINKKLNASFSILDLSKGSTLITSNNLQKISLQLDPDFSKEQKVVLKSAVEILAQIALDDDVINEALENSVSDPKPIPQMYKDSTIVNGIRKHTTEYAFLLNYRNKPIDIIQFKKQLSNALTTQTGDPALVVISSYKGNIWWGGSYYNYFYSTSQVLSKFSPGQGYFYLRLNSDSLAINKSPEFWASKIAHEFLHNLGYYHPIYNNPKERDLYNKGKEKAFIVAYESAILRKANKKKAEAKKFK